ncbi:metastasis-associated protein MTA3 isoform X2 [Phymastichus coffea]|uniref:metastasis-associated protein MTA3 isoform X2 n=1 Tax=Phymastichus coffea TaxID=108790 RepID=UPI00273B4840|nr:metastasis-associated protein MTA3 isoform X2 [Phymastichus coffea]
MPMPAEYHESHSNHENANFALGGYQDSSNMTANMYRVGDYVYFETSSNSPYQIRRIEELNKTANGNVEAKVMCFFRRRDLPPTLIMLADKHQLAEQQSSDLPKLLAEESAKDEAASLAASSPWLDCHHAAVGVDESVAKAAAAVAAAAAAASSSMPGNGSSSSSSSSSASAGADGIAGAGAASAAVAAATAAVVAATNLGNQAASELSLKQRHQMKHRELFLSRQVETMPATHIRGKCCVTLLNETESLLTYLNKEDSFFYCLVFDPAQRTLLADKGEIRVGSRYQADNIAAHPLSAAEREADARRQQDLEQLVWTPRHSLTDRQIDQFLVVSRSVGTFARALDCSSSVKQPSLHMSAAAASRDITLFHAMDTLHRHNYDVAKAMSSLVPSSGPVLCRDEMEEWSASEANLFEEALEKYGKDFGDIRTDFLHWKSLKNIIEYYYMWKTTDRYVQQKRVKAVEAESKLKQVYIPNYSKGAAQNSAPPATTQGGASIIPIGNSQPPSSNGKPQPASVSILNGSSNGNLAQDAAMLLAAASGKPCESCQTLQSAQWYPWGPSHMQYRLCQLCWTYWKKYGGLKCPTRMDEIEAERKRSGANSDEEGKGAAGAHRPHRCSIPSCGKEFKLKAHLSRHYASAHGLDVRGGAGTGGVPAGVPTVLGVGGGSPRPVMKTRSAFYLRTSALARAARRLCAAQLRSRHAARAPHQPINAAPLRHLCASPQLAAKTPQELRLLGRAPRPRLRPRVNDIATRLGDHPQPSKPGDWDWLLLTAPGMLKQPEHVSFPRPPKAPDGSLLYERVPNKSDVVDRLSATPPVPPILQTPQNTLKRTRAPFDELNGADGIAINAVSPGQPPPKRAHHAQPLHANARADHPTAASPATVAGASVIPPLVTTPLNGRAAHPHGMLSQGPMSRSNARKQVMSWMDAPDDLYFRATEQTKRIRKTLTAIELRRAARKPWRRLNVPQRTVRSDDMVVILD